MYQIKSAAQLSWDDLRGITLKITSRTGWASHLQRSIWAPRALCPLPPVLFAPRAGQGLDPFGHSIHGSVGPIGRTRLLGSQEVEPQKMTGNITGLIYRSRSRKAQRDAPAWNVLAHRANLAWLDLLEMASNNLCWQLLRKLESWWAFAAFLSWREKGSGAKVNRYPVRCKVWTSQVMC